MKIYTISGLGADETVFNYLSINAELVHLNWITPLKKESLKNYALRLSKEINTTEPFCILGVSFGGMIATEISAVLKPKATILISSTDTSKGLNSIYKLLGKLRLIQLIPAFCFKPPSFIANYLFGAKHKTILKKILDKTDSTFAKWASIAIAQWKNEITLTENVVKISGTKDKLIPSLKDPFTVEIKDGEHFMIVDKAEEISKEINLFLKNNLIN